MPKPSLRKSFKSFFQSHVDPDKDEQLKGTKSEMEGKVQRILNIIKTEDDKDGLVGMIQDFQNQYRSLFDRYDHLTEALRRRAHARRGTNPSSSSSDSDSGSDGLPNLRINDDNTNQELENFAVVVKDLELKIDSLSNLKDELEEQLRAKSQEVIQLQEEMENLKIRNSGLQEEKAVQERKISELQNEAAFQITALSEEVNSLLHENMQLQSEKSILEVKIERSKHESIGNLAQVENQNVELQNKIRDLEEKLTEEDELRLQNSEENGNTKMEEIIEDLKRDLEMKEDEVSTSVENLRSTEVKLRLTSQKLRITEQSLTEKEDSQRSKEEKLQEEKKLLKDKVETYKKVQSDVAKEVTEKVNDMMTGFDSFNVTFEECYGRSAFRLYEVVNKIGFVTKWIKESTGEKDRLKKETSDYINQLKDEKEQGLLLRAKVKELETRLQKDENEKDILVKQGKEKMTELERMIEERDAKMGELEREMNKKEVGILSLAEQKREAIKQLCIWIEYHRNRYDDLISKTSRRRQIAA